MSRRAAILALAGTMPDREVARKLSISHSQVGEVRRGAGISAYEPPSPRHGTEARWKRGCRCAPCVEARALAKAKRRRKKGEVTPSVAFPPDKSAQLTQMHREDQERTRAAARHDGKPWTEEDLEIAGDYSLSAVQVAEKLGRSLGAVRHIRRRHGLYQAWLARPDRGVQATGRPRT